jgi:hypothetical protein
MGANRRLRRAARLRHRPRDRSAHGTLDRKRCRVGALVGDAHGPGNRSGTVRLRDDDYPRGAVRSAVEGDVNSGRLADEHVKLGRLDSTAPWSVNANCPAGQTGDPDLMITWCSPSGSALDGTWEQQDPPSLCLYAPRHGCVVRLARAWRQAVQCRGKRRAPPTGLGERRPRGLLRGTFA